MENKTGGTLCRGLFHSLPRGEGQGGGLQGPSGSGGKLVAQLDKIYISPPK